jgi:hypothetical protein
MVSIAADDCDIERSLQKNVDLAQKDGAEFSDDLLLRSVKGYLSLEAPPESFGKLLIHLPWDCLVPIQPFQLAVNDDDIFIASHDAALTRGCVARMEAILELFNLTGKFAEHRRISPWALIAANPEVLSYIEQRRGAGDPELNKLVASADDKTLMLQTFLHTRAYNYKLDNAHPGTGHELHYPVLMPVLDLMNHHIYGAPYRDLGEAEGRALTMSRSAPLAGVECFACYGPYDSFDTWLGYDFVDGRVPFVCSMAMTIELPHLGTIRMGKVAKSRAATPVSVTDLFYAPKVLARRGNDIETASLLIPGPEHPTALRRALRHLITEMSPGHPRQNDLVLHAEEQIIAANRSYYSKLSAFLKTLQLTDPLHQPILDNFVRLCELQLARIQTYVACAEG